MKCSTLFGVPNVLPLSPLFHTPPTILIALSISCSSFVYFVHRRIEKRSKFSRRRRFHDDADIDYINERNANFNRKAARFYGAYTAEIRQNLERGTAV